VAPRAEPIDPFSAHIAAAGAIDASVPHNPGVRIGSRLDPDQGRTRTVVWANGGQTDLGVLLVPAIAVTVCVAGVVAAIELHGVARAVAVGLAILGGVYAAIFIVPLLLVTAVVHLVSRLQDDQDGPIEASGWRGIRTGAPNRTPMCRGEHHRSCAHLGYGWEFSLRGRMTQGSTRCECDCHSSCPAADAELVDGIEDICTCRESGTRSDQTGR
jgi:hypothetical protein